MIQAPSPQAAVGTLLALAVAVASLRLILGTRSGHLQVARCITLLLLQGLCALLLFLVMFPPATLREHGTLTVLVEDGWARGHTGTLVALPEYGGSGVERVPDLATALRRHPQTRRVVVRGRALPWRDHDAAGTVDFAFEASDVDSGLGELHIPRGVVAGQQVAITGRVDPLDAVQVELLDPAGRRLARTVPDADGGFLLPLTLRAAGALDLSVRVHLDGQLVEEAPVPIWVDEGREARVLLLAGAPSAELRALRRWATDAGVSLQSRIRISRDASLGDRPEFEVGELAGFDLLILDLRTWRSLDADLRNGVREAIDDGLGVLLRLDDTPDGHDRDSLQLLGFDVRVDEMMEPRVQLRDAHPDDARQLEGADPAMMQLTRRPVRVVSEDAATLLHSTLDEPLAAWHNRGSGRVALWWLDATYPLTVQGDPAAHASLWSRVVSELARPGSMKPIDPGVDRGVGARRVICGLQGRAEVVTPARDRVPLSPTADGCAGFWPESEGWHAVLLDDRRTPFHVGSATTLEARAMREATRRLSTLPLKAGSGDRAPSPGSPWPWFAGLIAALAALWWLERRRPPIPTTPSTGHPE